MFRHKLYVTFTTSLICSLAAAWHLHRAPPVSYSRQSAAAAAAPGPSGIEKSNFLNPKLAQEIKEKFQTPVFVYDEKTLTSQAQSALAFPNNYGLTVRFAMKACPNAAILQVINIINQTTSSVHN